MPLTVRNLPIDLTWRKCCDHDNDFNAFQIGFNLADFKDRHNIRSSSILDQIGLFTQECFLSMGKMLSLP